MTDELKEMSILEHLDELRKRLIICIISVILLSIIAFLKTDEIIIFLKEECHM
ncbi:twin-arginine translocase subunit TatC [Caloramator sp. mosi_1]|uniref:twin-arginine translocase subunit TatC n=1 Tax=Caloramator sp. mosi_1 TaxID=3023090 RepID=UPI00235DF9ED|nr:twin-arginine translocase subunit TatC [Caloramator sp. mosi_1]WDC85265.1 twin-arginine translocase subunit TatC [Caloramator sp. mosi_1]